MSHANLLDKLQAAKAAARQIVSRLDHDKRADLFRVARQLREQTPRIIEANAIDVAAEPSESLRDRLLLDRPRIEAMAAAVEKIAELDDPVGEIVRGNRLANGVLLQQIRVPLGVIGVIYEARPNVTVDIASLALKTGNAVLLYGGSAALNTNRVLTEVIRSSLDFPEAVQLVEQREAVPQLLQARGYIDVLIPRGGKNLIEMVVSNAKVPVIETGAGVVHVYVDESASADKTERILLNAKVQRPSVCNAAETLLIHEQAAQRLLPALLQILQEHQVKILGCERTRQLFPAAQPAQQWGQEHLSLCLSVRVVDSLDMALEHISTYSTKHTEVIITEDMRAAERFAAEVDAAAVAVNVSSRFVDGGEFGFGAEAGISTQKLHARGPMGLPELTSTKWILQGDGQVRA